MAQRLTQKVTVLLNEHAQQVDYAVSGGFALDMADCWILKKFIATTGHTATRRKEQNETFKKC